MIKVLFSCHVEPKRSDGNLVYLDDFFKLLKKLNVPFVLTFMAGGKAGDRLLKYVKLHEKLIPLKCQIGLHVHDHETKKSLELYKHLFGVFPKVITFGHWEYNNEDLVLAKKSGVVYEMSYSGHRSGARYFFKDQFLLHGLQEVPASCDPKYPINPLTTKYHFVLSVFLFVVFFFSSKTLHLHFHSYDLSENSLAKTKLQMLVWLFNNKLYKL